MQSQGRSGGVGQDGGRQGVFHGGVDAEQALLSVHDQLVDLSFGRFLLPEGEEPDGVAFEQGVPEGGDVGLGPGPVALPVFAVGRALAHFLDDVADGGHVFSPSFSWGRCDQILR